MHERDNSSDGKPSYENRLRKLADKMNVVEIRCPYCDNMTDGGFEYHLSVSVRCAAIHRTCQLLNDDYVLTCSGSPIDAWVRGHLPMLIRHDRDHNPWVPLWLGEMWFRATKNPITGHLDCSYVEFMASITRVLASSSQQSRLISFGKLRGIGVFQHDGSIDGCDGQTLWKPPVSDLSTLKSDADDLQRASMGMRHHQPFQAYTFDPETNNLMRKKTTY